MSSTVNVAIMSGDHAMSRMSWAVLRCSQVVATRAFLANTASTNQSLPRQKSCASRWSIPPDLLCPGISSCRLVRCCNIIPIWAILAHCSSFLMAVLQEREVPLPPLSWQQRCKREVPLPPFSWQCCKREVPLPPFSWQQCCKREVPLESNVA